MPLAIATLAVHSTGQGPRTPSTKGLRHVLWRKNTKISGQTLTDVNFPMSVA